MPRCQLAPSPRRARTGRIRAETRAGLVGHTADVSLLANSGIGCLQTSCKRSGRSGRVGGRARRSRLGRGPAAPAEARRNAAPRRSRSREAPIHPLGDDLIGTGPARHQGPKGDFPLVAAAGLFDRLLLREPVDQKAERSSCRAPGDGVAGCSCMRQPRGHPDVYCSARSAARARRIAPLLKLAAWSHLRVESRESIGSVRASGVRIHEAEHCGTRA